MGPYHVADGDSWAGKFSDSKPALDRKMTWLRKHGVIIFKNRGDIGPQKLYLNPYHNVSLKDVWKRQRRARAMFVNQEFDLSDLKIEVFAGTITYTWQLFYTGSEEGEYYIRVSPYVMDASDKGNTTGIIERYDFEYPVWFNIVKNSGRKSVYVIHNCVMDWYELHNFLNQTGPIGVDKNPEALGPFEVLQRVRSKVSLFANGPLLKNTEIEFAYLAELGT